MADPLDWSPYASRNEAIFCLGRFTDAALGSDIGLIWCDADAAMLLRRPRLTDDGFGNTLIASAGPPPPPPPPHDWLGRLKAAVEDALTRIGEAQMMEAEANLAMGQTIADWFADKDHEHEAGLAFDILGLAAFALLFVPGLGEAEMAFMGLGALARGTAVAAAGGAMCGLWSDGNYLRLRFGPGGREAAEAWDNTPEATTLSLAAAILALPDFAVGGIMTLRDLRALPGEIRESGAARAALQAKADAGLAKAARLEGRMEDAEAWRARKLKAKSAAIAQRAERLAARAAAADRRTRGLQAKLLLTLGLPAPATFIGTPLAEGYYAHDTEHDHPHDLGANIRTAGQYAGEQFKALRRLLFPPHPSGGAGRRGLGLRIGATSRGAPAPAAP